MRYRTKTITKTFGTRKDRTGHELACELVTIHAVPVVSDDPEENLALTNTTPREGITILTADPGLAQKFAVGKGFTVELKPE